ncbi:MAG TPA: hypothetical protein VGP25_16545 [Gemmatimonadaceae bacterium]|jgi:hypothetical protein|nr:hypothetical protein [Gemmatimonadaceae bacterium]
MREHSTDQQGDVTASSHVVVFSRSAATALGRVLNAMRDGWFLERRVRHVARMIAEEAHRQRLDADEMLAAMRREWPTVLGQRGVPDESGLRMLVEHLVRFCLEELRAMRGASTPATR